MVEFLQARRVETVLVGGLATDYCVKHTVRQLRQAGLRVILNPGAVRGVAPDTTDRALAGMATAGVVFIAGADALQRTTDTVTSR